MGLATKRERLLVTGAEAYALMQKGRTQAEILERLGVRRYYLVRALREIHQWSKKHER